MTFSTIKLSLILFGLAQLLRFKAFRHGAFRARLKERNLVAQIMARTTIAIPQGMHHPVQRTDADGDAALAQQQRLQIAQGP